MWAAGSGPTTAILEFIEHSSQTQMPCLELVDGNAVCDAECAQAVDGLKASR